ncbi:hypothetical protein C8R43DRAFT_1143424 [Mycena crocata]|nr:hypothetical protein C8R43DRAFT_1143424 [Mycena crocata]
MLDITWFGAMRSDPRPKIMTVSSESTSPCRSGHPATPIDLSGMFKLGYLYPIVLRNAAPCHTLTDLDLSNQDFILARHVLTLCPNICTLSWGDNGSGDGVLPPIVFPSIRTLTIASLEKQPPIQAPLLQNFILLDQSYRFSYDVLSEIAGHPDALPHMRTLDFFDARVVNDQLEAVLKRCPSLVTVRVDTRGDKKTAFYREINRRVKRNYAYEQYGLLSTVDITTKPGPTQGETAAATAHSMMRYLGRPGKKASEITFPPLHWRVWIADCRGYFSGSEKEMEDIRAENSWGEEFLAALLYDEEADPFLDDEPVLNHYCIVCVFTTLQAAKNCASRPVKFKGRSFVAHMVKPKKRLQPTYMLQSVA